MLIEFREDIDAEYEVTVTERLSLICTCVTHQQTGRSCPHIWGVRFLREHGNAQDYIGKFCM